MYETYVLRSARASALEKALDWLDALQRRYRTRRVELSLEELRALLRKARPAHPPGVGMTYAYGGRVSRSYARNWRATTSLLQVIAIAPGGRTPTWVLRYTRAYLNWKGDLPDRDIFWRDEFLRAPPEAARAALERVDAALRAELQVLHPLPEGPRPLLINRVRLGQITVYQDQSDLYRCLSVGGVAVQLPTAVAADPEQASIDQIHKHLQKASPLQDLPPETLRALLQGEASPEVVQQARDALVAYVLARG